MLIDTHAHLYSYEDVLRVVKDSADFGVETIVSISTDLATSKLNIDIASKIENVYSTVGVHPCDIEQYRIDDLVEIQNLCSLPKNKGIGEIGLDFYHSDDNRIKQFEFFDYQIDIAESNNMPIVIHARDSYYELIEYLKSKKIKSDFVVHCFTGSKEIAAKLVDLGSYISFTGIITFKKSSELREVAAFIPDDKIMIETDSPYLSPEPNRGKKNYPKNLIYIAECFSVIKNLSLEDMKKILKDNSVEFYKL